MLGWIIPNWLGCTGGRIPRILRFLPTRSVLREVPLLAPSVRPPPHPPFVSQSALSFVALTSWRSLRCSRTRLGTACSTCLGQETPWAWRKACVFRSGGSSSRTRRWHLPSSMPTPLQASRIVRWCPWRRRRRRQRRLSYRFRFWNTRFIGMEFPFRKRFFPVSLPSKPDQSGSTSGFDRMVPQPMRADAG